MHLRPVSFACCPNRVTEDAVRGLIHTLAFFDNVIVATTDVPQHVEALRQLLLRFNSINLKLHPNKMWLMRRKIRAFGQIITAEGVSPDPDKITEVLQWPFPSESAQVRSFLGVCGFLRPHIRHCAELCAPLEAAKTSDTTWCEAVANHEALLRTNFDLLKRAIATAPLLRFPDLSQPFTLATDASLNGIGGCLYQPTTGSPVPTSNNVVAFCSHALKPYERRYNVYRRELLAVIHCLRQFHHYLFGRRFTLETDHRSLIFLHSHQHNLSPTLGRWWEVLTEYDFAVRHVHGAANVFADALSRLYPSVWGVGPSLGALQDDSPSTAVLGRRGHIPEDDEREPEPAEEDLPNEFAEFQKLLGKTIPPASEREAILDEAHQLAHKGFHALIKTLYLERDLWWPTLRADVQRVVSHCDACQKFTIHKHGFHPARSPTAWLPMDFLQIDLCLSLPLTGVGYRYALVVIDLFTGFVWIRPLFSKSAREVAEQLYRIFGDFGVPRILHCDAGREFKNKILRALSRLFGIKLRFGSPYHPQSKAKVERAIRSIVDIIVKKLLGSGSDWDLLLPLIQFGHNSTVSSLTDSAPFSLFHGRIVNLFHDDPDWKPDSPDYEAHAAHLRELFDKVFPAVRERIEEKRAHEHSSLDASRRILSEAIPVGTRVVILDPHRSRKYAQRYIGPYFITGRVDTGSYTLKDDNGQVLDRSVPVEHIKLAPSVNPPSGSSTVEKILNHRGRLGNYDYLVQWAGESPSEASWTHQSAFNDTECLRHYWDRYAKALQAGRERNASLLPPSPDPSPFSEAVDPIRAPSPVPTVEVDANTEAVSADASAPRATRSGRIPRPNCRLLNP